MKKHFIALLAIAFVFVGCQEKENPALTLDDITTFATVSGSISYGHIKGVTDDRSAVVYDTLKLVDQVVEIKVKSSLYSNGGGNTVQTFSARTDANGVFNIRIPVLANANNFTIQEMSIRPFYIAEFPYSVASQEFDPNTFTWVTRYSIVKHQVYYDGALNLPFPGIIYPNRTYFLGNAFIPRGAFIKVGL